MSTPTPAVDYGMTCPRCGLRTVEMKTLLFHPCQQPAKRAPKRPKKGQAQKP